MSLYQVEVPKTEIAAYTHEILRALRRHVLHDGETVEPMGSIVTSFRSASEIASPDSMAHAICETFSACGCR